MLISIPVHAHVRTQAEPGPILLHVTESDSPRTFSFGFYLAKNETPAGIFFEDYRNPGEAGIQRFPFQTLTTPQVFYKKRGYDVAKVSYLNQILSVLYKKDVRQGDDAWIEKKYSVNCDPQLKCVVTDLETNVNIDGVELMIHYASILGISVATGVDSIKGLPATKPRLRHNESSLYW